jgi:hypothetical protein
MKRRERLKLLKNNDLGFLMGIAKNQKVPINGEKYTQVQNLEIPDDGLVVHLKKLGDVKGFRKIFKNEVDRYHTVIILLNKILCILNSFIIIALYQTKTFSDSAVAKSIKQCITQLLALKSIAIK